MLGFGPISDLPISAVAGEAKGNSQRGGPRGVQVFKGRPQRFQTLLPRLSTVPQVPRPALLGARQRGRELFWRGGRVSWSRPPRPAVVQNTATRGPRSVSYRPQPRRGVVGAVRRPLGLPTLTRRIGVIRSDARHRAVVARLAPPLPSVAFRPAPWPALLWAPRPGAQGALVRLARVIVFGGRILPQFAPCPYLPGRVDQGDLLGGRTDAGDALFGVVDAGGFTPGRVDAGDQEAGRVDAGDSLAARTDAGDQELGRVDAGDALSARTDAADALEGKVDAGDVEPARVDAGGAQAGKVDAADYLPTRPPDCCGR